MIQATKLPIYPIFLSLLFPLLLAACNIIPDEEPPSTEKITPSRETNEQRPSNEVNSELNQTQNQSPKTQTQEGLTITITNITENAV